MTTPDAGWYEDPEDPNSQRYWDGLEWTAHRQPKTTSASAGQSTTQTPQQPPGGPTPQNQLRPYVDKGRRFWSGLSGQQKVIVGIAAVLVAVAAIMVPVFAFGHGGSHPGSQYYQLGYESATSGAARESYIDLLCTGHYGCTDPGPDTVKEACGGGWVGEPNVPVDVKIADPDTATYQAKKDDFVKGCSDAFRAHPPSPTVTTRPRH